MSTVLLWTGGIGVVIALVALVVALLLGVRLGDLRSRISAEMARAGATLATTGETLDRTADSATSFGATLEDTGPALTQAADSISALVPALRQLRDEAGAVNVLGQRPLANIATFFGQTADQLAGLEPSIRKVSTSLTQNRDTLSGMATSLHAFGDEVDAMADRFQTGELDDGLGGLVALIVLLVILVGVGVAMPAVASLWIGLWLRQQLGLPVPRALRRWFPAG